jgi:hypothetical protein
MPQIAREAGKFQEKLVEMLASIGDALPRFQIYQIIFHNHERLLSALSDVYLDVIQFCVKAKEFFSSARGRLSTYSRNSYFKYLTIQQSRYQLYAEECGDLFNGTSIATCFNSASIRRGSTERQKLHTCSSLPAGAKWNWPTENYNCATRNSTSDTGFSSCYGA